MKPEWFYLCLFCGVCTTIIFFSGEQVCLALEVKMDNIHPVIGQPYFIRCTISINPSDKTVPTNLGVELNYGHHKCIVEDWLYCNKHVPAILSQDYCACSSKKLAHGHIIYRFFMYMQQATADIDGLPAHCCLSGCVSALTTDRQQINVLKFNKSPPPVIYNCTNGSVIFGWEFYATRNVLKYYLPYSIEWFELHEDSSEARIGYAKMLPNGLFRFQAGIKKQSQMVNFKNWPQLQLVKLQLHNDRNVKIRVTFNETNPQYVQKRSVSRFLRQATSARVAHTETNYTSTAALEREEMTSTDSTIPTTTTPAPIDLPEAKPPHIMEETVHLFITQPPSANTEVEISGVGSVTGSLIISCSVNDMTFPGRPPVNITIWMDNDVLISRTGTTNLRYSIPTVGEQEFTCGLEGLALLCLPNNDKRRFKAILSAKDVDIQTEVKGGINMEVVVFGAECCFSVLLMLWVISLFLSHLRMLLHVRKVKLMREMQGGHLYKLSDKTAI